MEKTQTKPRIRVGISEMDFPHQGKMLTAVHPFYGPANSKVLRDLIRKDGHIEQTSSQVTSFVHEYFNGEEPQAQEVNQIMRDGFLRGFTGILYAPEKGAFEKGLAHFIDYPKFNRESIVNRDNLLKRLDESYAQVPFKDLKNGPVDWSKVAKHPYFIAWGGGEEGAEKLAKFALTHPTKKAYIRVPNVSNLEKPVATIATLTLGYFSGGNMRVGSFGYGVHEGSYAFAVLKKASEDIASEK